MRKPCFGRWKSEIIPYVLANINMKTVQLLAKTIVAKLDKKEYLRNEDGGTSPQNQVHEALLYPDFEIFLSYK